jgi:hypothetical protein
MSTGAIVGISFGLVLVAALAYFYYKKTSDGNKRGNILGDPLLPNDGMVPLTILNPTLSFGSLKDSGTAPEAEKDETYLQHKNRQPEDTMEINSGGDTAVVSVLERVETFRVRLGFQISLRKTPDSDEKTGRALLQGSTFEVDKKATIAKGNLVFLHAVGEGWAPQHYPQSNEALCERAWSIGRSEVDFDDLKQATNNFDQALEIGDGGSCTVYRANIDSIPCAIKVLAANADEWEAKQFASEVNLLRRVQHPNLCRLYASSTNGPRKCLVLEHMGGGALDKRLVAQPPLGWQQRVSIALETCRGLDYLHALNPPMIHRDVSEICEAHRKIVLIFLKHFLPSLFAPFVLQTIRSRARTSSSLATRAMYSTKTQSPRSPILAPSVPTTVTRKAFSRRPPRRTRRQRWWLAQLHTCLPR